MHSSEQRMEIPENGKLAVCEAVRLYPNIWKTSSNRGVTSGREKSDWNNVANCVGRPVADCKKDFKAVQNSFKAKIAKIMLERPDARDWNEIDMAVKGEKKKHVAVAANLQLWKNLDWLVRHMATDALNLRNENSARAVLVPPSVRVGERMNSQRASSPQRKRRSNSGDGTPSAKRQARNNFEEGPVIDENLTRSLLDLKQEIADDEEGLQDIMQGPASGLNAETDGPESSNQSNCGTGDVLLQNESLRVYEISFGVFRDFITHEVEDFSTQFTEELLRIAMSKLSL